MKPSIVQLGILLATTTALKLPVARADEPTDETAPPEHVAKSWRVGLGLGSGVVRESGDRGLSTTLQLGYRVQQRLEVLLDGERTTFSGMMSRDSSVTLGMRWLAFDSGRATRALEIHPLNVSLKAGIGYAERVLRAGGLFEPWMGDHQIGFAATGGIDWTPILGRGFAIGIAASDTLAVDREGVRHDVSVNAMTSIVF